MQIKVLRDVFSQRPKGSSLMEYMNMLLYQFGYRDMIMDTGYNYLLAKGDIDIALVAHLDTVHEVSPYDIFYDKEQKVMWSPQGLGADDRAGATLILNILEQGLRPHIILTTGEEKGCIGASQLVQDYPEPPFNIRFMIELDRSGSNDAVFYDCMNHSFIDYITTFGFEFDEGSFTDIVVLGEEWNVAAVNLSVGYYYEHSKSEYWDLAEAEVTLDRVIEILNDTSNTNSYIFVPITKENRIIKCGCGKICRPGEYTVTSWVDDRTNATFCYPVCFECAEYADDVTNF